MRNFLYTCAAFLALLAFCQILVSRLLVGPLPEMTRMDALLREGYRIIYFGDSAVDSSAPGETERSSIAKMLARMNPSLTVTDFSHGADNPSLYVLYLRHIARSSDTKPETVIIPINLRLFATGWHRNPAEQFEKRKFYWSAYLSFLKDFYHPLATINAIDMNTIPEADFLRMPVRYGTTTIGTVARFEEEKKETSPNTQQIRDMYIYAYMEKIEQDHPLLRAMEELADTGQRADIHTLFYITPIDYQSGEKAVGPDFKKQVAENANLVCTILAKKELPCLNLAFSLDAEQFSHPAYPDEHLRAKGRAFIAQKVTETLRTEMAPLTPQKINATIQS